MTRRRTGQFLDMADEIRHAYPPRPDAEFPADLHEGSAVRCMYQPGICRVVRVDRKLGSATVQTPKGAYVEVPPEEVFLVGEAELEAIRIANGVIGRGR